MSENAIVQPLGTSKRLSVPLKRERDFDPEKQRELRIRCEQLAKEILARKKK
ncbi:MAG: hypothetical protein ABSF24_02450 [Candidatus Bathyarchaeia archaeon]|jgi:hypothetical protein